ncbi:MAG: HAD-IIIC family phosphatase [Magnetococcus sp. YQC-9]
MSDALPQLPCPERIRTVCTLAGSALNTDQSIRLARRWRKARIECPRTGLPTFRLAIASNATLGLILPCIEVSALRHGLHLEVIATDFGQTMQAALDVNSSVNAARPDAILMAMDHRGLPFLPGFDPEATDSVCETLDHLERMRDGFLRNGCQAVIWQNLAPTPEGLFGSLEPMIPNTWRWRIERFNQGLIERLQGSSDRLLDVAGLAMAVGLHRWHDARGWQQARLPFSTACVPLYADHLSRLLAAMRGRSRKCLVLDLDNTLWGGVIGDDGMTGIRMAEGDPVGEAYRAMQRLALDLRARGILLAICSKNDAEIASRAFREHPEMILRPEHIAVFIANWEDKASNLRRIAERLNIGIDSLVFVDDNPVERAQVRSALPEVAVPELPEDPALYVTTLLAGGYFEAIGFTSEDRQRADQYQANATREESRAEHADLDGFLQSLEMRLLMQPFDALGRARIVQLVNKTNQFNLTTQRYDAREIERMEQDPSKWTLQVRLLDRFGDNGMISVVIIDKRADGWMIEAWLMSCRVISRRVEEAVFERIVAAARQAGVEVLLGSYVATERNGLVREHYRKLGFERLSGDDAASIWRFRVADHVTRSLPMIIEEN